MALQSMAPRGTPLALLIDRIGTAVVSIDNTMLIGGDSSYAAAGVANNASSADDVAAAAAEAEAVSKYLEREHQLLLDEEACGPGREQLYSPKVVFQIHVLIFMVALFVVNPDSVAY